MAKKPTAKATKTTKVAKKPLEKKVAKIKVIKDAMSKTELLVSIAEATDLSKKQVVSVIDHLVETIHGHLRKGGAGIFTLPGLLKLQVTRKPAVKARKGVSPFTGEEIVFKAKPARNVVKARALKKLKDVVA